MGVYHQTDVAVISQELIDCHFILVGDDLIDIKGSFVVAPTYYLFVIIIIIFIKVVTVTLMFSVLV